MSRSAVTKNVSLFFNCRHRQTLLLLAPAQQQQQQQRSCNDFHGSNVQVGNDDVENHDVDVENMNKMHFSKLVRLDRAWRRGDPEFVRQECASFVLSLEIVETVFDRCRCDENGNGDSGTRAPAITLVAGLNNGDIEEWDLGNHVSFY